MALYRWFFVLFCILLPDNFAFSQEYGVPQYTFEGCFAIQKGLQVENKSEDNCALFCFGHCNDYDYFGVKLKKCYCLKEDAIELSPAPNETCKTSCPGNSSEICGEKGNPGFMSLYNNTKSVPKARTEFSKTYNGLTGALHSHSELMINETISAVNNTYNDTRTTDGNLNSNDTTFVEINSTSLPEVNTTLPEGSTSLKEAITLSEGTAISAEPDGIVTETTNFNSNATTPPFLSPITELGDRNTSMNDNSTSRNMSIVDKPSVAPDHTHFPDIVADVDEGLVAGMSILVVGLFASCIFAAFARRCYRNRRQKGENTFYEEVEDAATSCSIEGSSNVKFLIARARNINKSRIEQINEEWRTGKPLIKPECSESKSDVCPPPLQEHHNTGFSKSSIKSQSRRIIEDSEDSEYATAEPDEDMYSLVGDDDQDDMYDKTTFANHKNNSLPVVASVSRLAQIKLQRSFDFDDGVEDPYEETPNDQYDQVDIPRSHRMLSTSGDGCCDGKQDEDLYDLTDDCEYDIADNTRRHIGKSLHRSKSQDRLTGTINGGETISESDSTSKLYSDSFECEYDVLNKPRFRVTISSDNYDTVKLPWECDEKRNEDKNECEVVQSTFESLENCQKAQDNVYSDIDSLLEGNTDTNANEEQTIVRDEQSETNNENETVVDEVNGNIFDSENDSSKHVDNIELETMGCSHRSYIPDERPCSLETSCNSNGPCSSVLMSDEHVLQSTCDNTLFIQNKCYGYKIENGNILDNKVNGLNVNEFLEGEMNNSAQLY